jgi:hypothetical protein
VPTIVSPHPIRPVWPIMTPGRTGSVAPITFHPGAFRCTMYLIEGFETLRCGSLAMTTCPFADSLAAVTQLLLPGEFSCTPRFSLAPADIARNSGRSSGRTVPVRSACSAVSTSFPMIE